jgi:hypothetical protein
MMKLPIRLTRTEKRIAINHGVIAAIKKLRARTDISLSEAASIVRTAVAKPLTRPSKIVGDKGTKVWAAIRVDNLARMQHEMKHDRSKVDLEAAKLVRTLGRMLEVVGDSAGSNYAYWIATQLETRP